MNSIKYKAFISLDDFTFDPEVNNLKLVMKQWTAEFKGKTQYNNWRMNFKNATDSNNNNKTQLESIYIYMYIYILIITKYLKQKLLFYYIIIYNNIFMDYFNFITLNLF